MNNAQKIMQEHGKTFALAARLLTPASRHDATELYAFARTVDDWIDLGANKDAAQANIAALQTSLQLGVAPIKTLLNKHAIADATIQAFLQAQLHDQGARHIADEQALIDYSYGVAGSIGAMMRPILGAPEVGEMYAISLGIAMQMTNIARDVLEDAVRGRVYIPATFFSQAITAQQIAQPSQQQAQAIFAAITQLLQLAEEYYALAARGYAHIPLRNRLSIVAAGAMYRAIGVKILQRGAARYWPSRVSIGLFFKVGIAWLAITKTLLAHLFSDQLLSGQLLSGQLFSSKVVRKTEVALTHAIEKAIAGFNVNNLIN